LLYLQTGIVSLYSYLVTSEPLPSYRRTLTLCLSKTPAFIFLDSPSIRSVFGWHDFSSFARSESGSRLPGSVHKRIESATKGQFLCFTYTTVAYRVCIRLGLMKTVRVNVMLGEKQHEFLKKLADAKGLNVSILIRQLVEKQMERKDDSNG
jgi:predicted DNA binding CopG/RHH family protein